MNTSYSSCEQFFQCGKATLFKDFEAAQRILETNIPAEQKRLGDTIRGFKKDLWEKSASKIMKQGLEEKFRQKDDLKQFLLSTGDRYLIEASPHDKLWGSEISLQADTLLMEVREDLLIIVDKSPSQSPASKKVRYKSPIPVAVS